MEKCIEYTYNERILTSNLKGYNIDRTDNLIEVNNDETLIAIGKGSAIIQPINAFESLVGCSIFNFFLSSFLFHIVQQVSFKNYLVNFHLHSFPCWRILQN